PLPPPVVDAGEPVRIGRVVRGRPVPGRVAISDDVAGTGSDEDTAMLRSPVVARSDWMLAATPSSGGRSLPPADRATLSAYWDDAAAFEHASVAAFARESLRLAALGAPPELLAGAHAAALDEIEHARVCFALAASFADAPRGPGRMPPVTVSSAGVTLEDLACDALLGGAVNEAVAAQMLLESSELAGDDALRSTLARMAEDEERHASLAFQTIAWAIQSGGEAVKDAVRLTVASLVGDAGDGAASTTSVSHLESHGYLGRARERAIRASVVRDVVVPCIEAALSAA
ncbi:MAG: ferritin-like domain-containing protein, partial [Deltaproteobacteria bacterium]